MIKIQITNPNKLYTVLHFTDLDLYKLYITNKQIEIEITLKKELLKSFLNNLKDQIDKK